MIRIWAGIPPKRNRKNDREELIHRNRQGRSTEGEKEIVRRKTYPVRPMSAEDAALQMELLGHSFFVFVNQDTDKVNVLYLRKDGNLGLMEPED